MTDRTIKACEDFTAKWSPEGRRKEFVADLRALIFTAVAEATAYMLGAPRV